MMITNECTVWAEDYNSGMWLVQRLVGYKIRSYGFSCATLMDHDFKREERKNFLPTIK